MRFLLNEPDFELQNFSVKECVRVIIEWAAETGFDFPLTENELVPLVATRVREKNESLKKAFDSACHIKKIHWPLNKGEDWGRRLARYLTKKRNDEVAAGTYNENNLSKIEEQILSIMEGSQPYIDYQLSMAHTNFDDLRI